MRPNRQAGLVVLLVVAACSKPQSAMHAPAPDRYTAHGDTARFGSNAIVSVDAKARWVTLDLPTPARVYMFAIDPQGDTHLMARCYAEQGRHHIQPTLATVGGRPAIVQGRPMEAWTYGMGYDALLVVLIDEQPREARQACNNSGDGRFAGRLPPEEALKTLALGLKRYPDSRWASYLVEP